MRYGHALLDLARGEQAKLQWELEKSSSDWRALHSDKEKQAHGKPKLYLAHLSKVTRAAKTHLADLERWRAVEHAASGGGSEKPVPYVLDDILKGTVGGRARRAWWHAGHLMLGVARVLARQRACTWQRARRVRARARRIDAMAPPGRCGR